jgi:hypothetical protein
VILNCQAPSWANLEGKDLGGAFKVLMKAISCIAKDLGGVWSHHKSGKKAIPKPLGRCQRKKAYRYKFLERQVMVTPVI